MAMCKKYVVHQLARRLVDVSHTREQLEGISQGVRDGPYLEII